MQYQIGVVQYTALALVSVAISGIVGDGVFWIGLAGAAMLASKGSARVTDVWN